jgi:hypothetical protein
MSQFFKKPTSEKELTFRYRFDRQSGEQAIIELGNKLFNKDQTKENAIAQPAESSLKSRSR